MTTMNAQPGTYLVVEQRTVNDDGWTLIIKHSLIVVDSFSAARLDGYIISDAAYSPPWMGGKTPLPKGR